MTLILPNGLGASTGDPFVVNSPFYTIGTVLYVDSLTGSDTNSGLSEDAAFATLGAAVAVAVAGDVIVLASTHDETITTTVTLAAAVTVTGSGWAAGKPSTILRWDGAGAAAIQVTADGVEIRNIYFPERTSANAGLRILIGNGYNNLHVERCYFEQGDDDQGNYGQIGGVATASVRSYVEIRSCTFVNTRTVYDAAGPPALVLLDFEKLRIIDCIVDGGSFGFGAATSGLSGVGLYAAASSGSVTDIRVQGLTLLHGADAYISGSTTSRVSGLSGSGSAQVTL